MYFVIWLPPKNGFTHWSWCSLLLPRSYSIGFVAFQLPPLILPDWGGDNSIYTFTNHLAPLPRANWLGFASFGQVRCLVCIFCLAKYLNFNCALRIVQVSILFSTSIVSFFLICCVHLSVNYTPLSRSSFVIAGMLLDTRLVACVLHVWFLLNERSRVVVDCY